MTFLIEIIFIFLIIFYLILSIWLFCSIKKLRSETSHTTSDQTFPMVSIVIAARNEEKNIKQCLEKCVNQAYPSIKFEIVVVNDRSEDKTAKIIKKFAIDYKNVRLINIEALPAEYKNSGKKYALKQGIENSKGEIILLTDADCLPKTGWIKGIVQYFM